MQNIDMNMCEKFQYDRLRNDKTLGDGKSDNNKNNVRGIGDSFPGPKHSLCGYGVHSRSINSTRLFVAR